MVTAPQPLLATGLGAIEHYVALAVRDKMKVYSSGFTGRVENVQKMTTYLNSLHLQITV